MASQAAEKATLIARAHRRYGTTACLPTLITDRPAKAIAAIAAAESAAGGDGILGLHLEGPFISPARPGIHRSDCIAMAVPFGLNGTNLGQLGRQIVGLLSHRER